MENYELSKLAAGDIDRIYEYGILTFGLSQAQTYLLGLYDLLQMLGDNQFFGRSAENLAPNLRKIEYYADVIYYIPNDKRIYVVRIIGKWMDASNHL